MYEDILQNRFIGPAAILKYRDGDVETIDINDKYLPEMGMNIDKKDYIEARLQDCFDEGNLQIFRHALKRCIETGDEQGCETWRSLLSPCCGEDRICLKSKLILLEKAEDGAIVFEAIRNITQERRTLDTLADAESRYMQASEQINIYNWEYVIATKEMRPCYRCMRDLGLPAVVRNYPETAIDMGIFPPDYADMYREMMRKVDAGATELEADIPLTVGRIPFRVRYTTSFDENGKPVKAFGSATLISETELGHISLDNSIISTLAQEYACIYLVDLKKDTLKVIKNENIIILDENGSFDDLTALLAAKLDGISEEFSRIVKDKDAIRTSLLKDSDRREFVYKDEELERWVRISIHVAERDNGELARLLIAGSFVDDMRAQKLDADRLIAAQKAELEDRQGMLVAALEEANRANRAKTAFFSSLSHDIRTPMGAITGFSRLALEDIDDKERLRDHLGRILTAGDHLLNLINDILDMSRIESGKMEFSPTPVKLKDLVGECEGMIRGKMEEKGVKLAVDIRNMGDDVVRCDKLRFRQILLNLLSNAYKFTPSGGKVLLGGRLLERGDELVYEIRVRDTGAGMSEEFKEHIWEAFSREDTSLVHDTPGTGLGMSIVRNIVNIMQGTIDLKTELGKGSEFIVVLPFEPVSGDAEIPTVDVAVSDAMNRSYDGKKILVVDDNPVNLKLAEYVLVKFGFTVLQLSSGVEAVDFVKNSKHGDIDLILMDIQMPVMDGLEATRRIRAIEDKELSRLPIIAMTANAFESDIQDALDAGMDAHVAKPFRNEDLIMKIAGNLK